MVSGWLIKVVLGIALVGFLIIEAGSPLVTKAQAGEAAQEIADQTTFALRDRGFTQAVMRESCESEADSREVELISCEFDTPANELVVRIRKEARSILLKKWSATEDWYYPEVTARSKRK